MQRSNMQILTVEIVQTYDLLKFAVARSNSSSFLLIAQYEMPFRNKSEATKRLKDQKTSSKCTNAMNHRSRVWPYYFIYHHWDGFFFQPNKKKKKISTNLLQRAPLLSYYQHYFQPLHPPICPRKKETFSTFLPQCGLYKSVNLP